MPAEGRTVTRQGWLVWYRAVTGPKLIPGGDRRGRCTGSWEAPALIPILPATSTFLGFIFSKIVQLEDSLYQ